MIFFVEFKCFQSTGNKVTREIRTLQTHECSRKGRGVIAETTTLCWRIRDEYLVRYFGWGKTGENEPRRFEYVDGKEELFIIVV